MSLGEAAVATAFLDACHAELDALKPGNVHRFAPGHGMSATTFEASAAASAQFIAKAGAPVGARVLAATRASLAAVGLNANLGIALLAAPLARAAEGAPRAATPAEAAAVLRQGIGQVLAELTPHDARDAFAAIALASPGGLGRREEHDVRAPAVVGLVEAMRLAAGRDLVARQYSGGFAEVFDVGLPALTVRPPNGAPAWWPVTACYLAFASAFPDSHIERKYGPGAAEDVRNRMESLRSGIVRAGSGEDALAMLLAFDAELKAGSRNPGTSADLTVASVFAANLARRLAERAP